MERIVLLDDKAVGTLSPSEDILNLGELVRIVANSLRHSDGPMVIHVDGGWGRGKTSFCRVLEEELRPDLLGEEDDGTLSQEQFGDQEQISEDYTPAAPDTGQGSEHDVDVAWYIASDQDGPPEDAILHGIAMAITGGDRDEALSIVRTWGSGANDLEFEVARRESFRAWARRALGWVENPLMGDGESVSLGKSRVERSTSRDIAEPGLEMEYKIDVPRRRTAVLIIDDLDRCSPEWVLRVLDAVRLYVSCEGIAFVIAADREVIDGAFSRTVESLGVDGVRRSGEAMEKYIRHRIQIPSLAETPPENVYSSMRLLQNEIFEGTGFEILCGPTADFEDGIGTALALTFTGSLTLRRLKRILNELATRLARIADRMNLDTDSFEHEASDGQAHEVDETRQNPIDHYYRVYFANCVWVVLSYQWPRLIEGISEPIATRNYEKLFGEDTLIALGLLGQQSEWPNSILENLINHTAGESPDSKTDFRTKWETCLFLAKCGMAWDSYFGKSAADELPDGPTEFVEASDVQDVAEALDPNEIQKKWRRQPEPDDYQEFLDDHRRALLGDSDSGAYRRTFYYRIDWGLRHMGADQHTALVELIALLSHHEPSQRVKNLYSKAEKTGVFGGATRLSKKMTGDYVAFLVRDSGSKSEAAKARKFLNIYLSDLETPRKESELLPLAIAAVLYGKKYRKSVWRRRAEKLVDHYFERAKDTRTPGAARDAVRILRADGSFDSIKWSEISQNRRGRPHSDPTLRWLAAEGLRHDDATAAIELYEGLEGSLLWMPSVLHNLALLHSLSGNIEQALQLWEALYRTGYRDTRMQREFSKVLSRQARRKDASLVKSGRELEGSFNYKLKKLRKERIVEL
ncbi:MAG: P-loop NTPase fold protein [Verrucomicrobiota bacterium]